MKAPKKAPKMPRKTNNRKQPVPKHAAEFGSEYDELDLGFGGSITLKIGSMTGSYRY